MGKGRVTPEHLSPPDVALASNILGEAEAYVGTAREDPCLPHPHHYLAQARGRHWAES